jgi:hypothetical protein
MWLQRRNPRLPHRTRRRLLLVEELEKRELLSGTPRPVSPPSNQFPTFPGLLAPVSPDTLFSAQGLPYGTAGPSGSSVPGQGWQSVGQSAASLYGSVRQLYGSVTQTAAGALTGAGTVHFGYYGYGPDTVTATLAGSYAVTGTTSVENGSLTLTGTVNAADLSVNHQGTVTVDTPAPALLGQVELVGRALTVETAAAVSGPFAWAAGGALAGPGTMTLRGSTTISGNNSATDLAIVNTGTATWSSGTVCFYGSSSFTNGPTGTFSDPIDGTFGSCDGECQDFVNQGLFVKSGGTGTTGLEMQLFNSGTVEVLQGVLDVTCGYVQGAGGSVSGSVSGTVTNPGTYNAVPSPNPPPVLTNYTQTATGILNEQIGGLTPGTQYGQIIVNGFVNLAGTLQVTLINGFAPHVGDQFAIINNQGPNPVNGTFAALPEGATFIASGYQFQISYAGGTDHQDVTLTVTAVATTTNVTSSVDPSDLDQSVTFTATVGAVPAGAAAPTGSVQFQVDGVNAGSAVPLSGGSASFTTAALATGPHTITALYGGDAYSLPSSANLTQNVQAPTASAGGPYTIAEGGSLTLDASGSSDPGGSSLTYSWDVNGDAAFGDASGVKPTLTWSQLEALGINDGPTTFNVQVQVMNAYGGSTISPAATLTVSDTPVSNLQLALAASSINEGGSASLSGTFTNPSPVDAHTVVVNWGDGSANTTVQLAAGAVSFSAISHPYVEESAGQSSGSYTIQVTVSDNEGGSVAANTAIRVNDAPLSDTTTTTALSATEGSSTGDQVVGTFADGDPNATSGDTTAIIYWGDNTSSAASAITLSGGTFSVHGAHTYAEEGTYHPYAVVTDNEGNVNLTAGRSSLTTSQPLVTVTVADAALSAGAFTPPVPTEGAPFGPTTVFHFTDADPSGTVSDYVATVQTGDATLTSTANPGNVQIVANGGGVDVRLAYTYAEELSNKTFRVAVSDAGGANTSASTTTFSVADAPLAATGTAVTPVTGTAFTGVVASFTDADPAGTATDYTATITWGNGKTSAGTIAANGQGGFAVTGTNTYTADGTYTITVMVKDAGGSSVTAHGTAYVGGLATHLNVTAATAATAGTPFALTVEALDAAGNPAYGYAGTVHFTSTDAQGVLPADYTFTAGDLGTHVFTVTLKTAATQSVTATDTANGKITGKQGSIVVSPGAVSRFQVVSSAGSVTAGTALNVTVTAQDAYGNTVTGYRGTVHLTSTDPQAVLPANYTFTAMDAGKHTFSVTLKTAGSQTMTVTDTASGAVTGTSGSVTVTPAAATHFKISAPASVKKGVAFSFTVTALDAYGNVATGYLGTVAFTSSDPKAGLPASYTFTAANAGVATFTATFNTVGVQSLTATDTKTKSITGTDGSIQVS